MSQCLEKKGPLKAMTVFTKVRLTTSKVCQWVGRNKKNGFPSTQIMRIQGGEGIRRKSEGSSASE